VILLRKGTHQNALFSGFLISINQFVTEMSDSCGLMDTKRIVDLLKVAWIQL